MREFFVICIFVFLSGCAMYEEDIKKVMTDPVYADYISQKEEAEGQYLEGSMTYAVYLERLRELDSAYEQTVEERNRKLQDGQ